MICTHCKSEVEQGNYCPKCGKTLGSKRRIGILSLLCVLIIGSAAYFFVFGNLTFKVTNNVSEGKLSEIQQNENNLSEIKPSEMNAQDNRTVVDDTQQMEATVEKIKEKENEKTENANVNENANEKGTETELTKNAQKAALNEMQLHKSSNEVVKDKIVYYIDMYQAGLYKISVEGVGFKKLTDKEISGGFILLDNKIIFASDAIYSMNLDGTAIQKLVSSNQKINDFYVYGNTLYYSINTGKEYSALSLDLYKANLKPSQGNENTRQGDLVLGKVSAFCFDEEGFLYFALESSGANEQLKKFDIYKKKPSEEAAAKIYTLNEGRADIIHSMKIENGELYIDTSPVNYGVRTWNRLNKDGSDFNEIYLGSINHFTLHDGNYYFTRFLRIYPSLIRAAYDEITDIYHSEDISEGVLNWNADEFYIYDNKIYLTYYGVNFASHLFRQNLDGTNRELLCDFMSFEDVVPEELQIGKILYADENYTYFLGGYVKNDGTKLCLINTQTGAKKVYTKEKKNDKIMDWQIAYENFLSYKSIFDYNNKYAFQHLDEDEIPELLICNQEEEKLFLNVYTIAEEEGISEVRLIDQVELSEGYSMDQPFFDLYFDRTKYGFYALKSDPGKNKLYADKDSSYDDEIIFYSLDGGQLNSKSLMKNTINVHSFNAYIANLTYAYEAASRAVSQKEYYKAYKDLEERSIPIFFDDLLSQTIMSALYKDIYNLNKVEKVEEVEEIHREKDDDENSSFWVSTPHYYGDIIIEENGTILYSTYSEIYSKMSNDQEAKAIVISNNLSSNSFYSKGEYLYFSSNNKYNPGIFRVTKDGTQLTKLCDDQGFYFTMGDSADWLYYSNSEHFSAASEPSIKRLNLKTNETEELFKGHAVSLSIVGDWIYFYELDKNQEYLVDMRKKLSYVSRIKTDGTAYQRYDGEYFSNGFMYADKDYIYFNHTDGKLRLHRMKQDGSSMEALVPYDDLCESVAITSNYIFYSNGSDKIVRMNLDGSGRKEILSGENCMNLKVYGDYLYFYQTKGSSPGNYRMNLDGAEKIAYSKEGV